MYIGHYAIGFAAKRAAPGASLGVLMAAPILLDLLWPVLVLAGIERVHVDPGNTAFTPLSFDYYPLSHSFTGAGVLAVVFAGVYWLIARYAAGAAAAAIGVLSHWVLDALSHRPDLPLSFSDYTLVGLGLWNSVPGTLIVEGSLFAVGVSMYAGATHPLDRRGALGFWSFVSFAALVYVANAFGPPPRSATDVAVVGLAQFMVPVWAAWYDRHRKVAAAPYGAAA